MAKSKTKPRGANKYTPPKKSGAPGWIWLVAGIVIGGFIMFLMKLEPKQDIRNGQKPVTTVTSNQKTDTNKTKFEFRNILTGNETSQPPLTEQQRKQLDGQRAADILAGKTPSTVPTVQQPISPKTSQSQPRQVQQSAQVSVVTPPTNTNFFLQIGSYPTKNGAESIRAQVIMLGQIAKLETTTSNNKTWYRVLVGPFNSKNEAAKSQKLLSTHGFKQTLVVPRKAQ